jgi:hypothetical protein
MNIDRYRYIYTANCIYVGGRNFKFGKEEVGDSPHTPISNFCGFGKWRWAAFPIAPGPSAVSGRTEYTRIFDSLQSELPASVAPRSTAAPVGPRSTQPLAFGSSNSRDVRARATKICGGVRTRSEAVLLDRHAFHATAH